MSKKTTLPKEEVASGESLTDILEVIQKASNLKDAGFNLDTLKEEKFKLEDKDCLGAVDCPQWAVDFFAKTQRLLDYGKENEGEMIKSESSALKDYITGLRDFTWGALRHYAPFKIKKLMFKGDGIYYDEKGRRIVFVESYGKNSGGAPDIKDFLEFLKGKM